MVNRPQLLLVRPEPSRGLSAFDRPLGLTLLVTHARAHGLQPRLTDLTFDAWSAAVAGGARVAALSPPDG